MSDKTEIKNPIQIKDNSTERVAFDLMQKIVDAEISYGKGDYLKPTPREYFLKLYNMILNLGGEKFGGFNTNYE